MDGCSSHPWECDKQQQVCGKENKKIPVGDLGKKLPKEAVEEEGVEAPREGHGEQDGQEMPGGSGVGNSHPEASSRFISHPAH